MRYINEKLQKFEKFLNNKSVAIFGVEPSNLPLLDYVCNKGANVTVFDKRNIDEIEKDILDRMTARCVKYSLGEHCLINLVGFDVVFRPKNCRPDLPELKAEGLRGALVTSEVEVALDVFPRKDNRSNWK